MLKVSPNIFALGWVSFFTDMASAMVKPLIPIYVVIVLNQGMDKLGYVLAITTLVSYLLRWVGGYLSDKFQITKPLLLIGYSLSAITKPLLAYTSSWVSVAAISATERLGKAIRSAPKDMLISASAQQQNQGKAFGLHKTLDIAGETIGGIIAFLLLSWLGQSADLIRTMFELTIIPGIISVLILIFFVKDTVKHSHTKSTKAPHHSPSNESWSHFDPSLWSWFTVYFLAVFFMLNDAFMVMRGSEIGIGTHWLPLLMVVSALTQTLISYRIGKRLDSQGAQWLLRLSLWAGVLSILLLFFHSPTAIILAFIFQGIFVVGGFNALRSRIGQTTQNKGKAYGLFYLGTAMAMALGNLLIGLLWEQVSVYAVLSLSAIGLIGLLVVVTGTKGWLANSSVHNAGI